MGEPAVPAASLRLQALSGSFELGKSMAEGLALRHAVPRALFPSHSLVSPGLNFTPEAEDVPRSGALRVYILYQHLPGTEPIPKVPRLEGDQVRGLP